MRHLVEDLREFKSTGICKTVLTHESGDPGVQFNEKTEGKKYLDTVPLTVPRSYQPHFVSIPGLKLIALNLVSNAGPQPVHTLVPPALGAARRQETGLTLLVRTVLVRTLLALNDAQSCYQLL
jgi:hypothetical protein